MTTTDTNTRFQAHKAPFEAFGILYYPLFEHRDDLTQTVLDDDDMAWAVTADANLDGTGYTLSQQSVLTLAAYHHKMADLARTSGLLPLVDGADDSFINPLADIRRLVPEVTASPMYPDFPQQVMEMDEAQYRFDQQRHYLSTYGTELIAGLLGFDVTVSEGWMPSTEATSKDLNDKTLVAPKVLHVIVTVEDLRAVVAARLARATRMHPSEIATTILVFEGLGKDSAQAEFPKVAFHENMMEIIDTAARRDSATLERVATGLAQHPGDLLKATMHVLEGSKSKHLATRQKKGLCRAFEHFDTMAIARNIADAGKRERRSVNYLSAERFGGPRLREAIRHVENKDVRSWTSEVEKRWDSLSRESGLSKWWEDWTELLAFYGQRPGVLLRSLMRIIRAGCPTRLVAHEVSEHVGSYSLPTLIRTITLFSNATEHKLVRRGWADFSVSKAEDTRNSPAAREKLRSILRSLIEVKLRSMDTPLRGKRVHMDTAGVSLCGSVLMPNETGNTATAWPPVGIAFDLPVDKTVRFFTFWDDRTRRVDIDLHFIGKDLDGSNFHIGWNALFSNRGLTTSGDVTTRHNSVEYLDANMAKAIESGVHFAVQKQHIYSGRWNWRDVETCYSGALLVGKTKRNVKLYNSQNLLFRDDLTGRGNAMTYAVINFPQHYVRILRGSDIALSEAGFSLGDYLDLLFEAQGVTLVESPEEADLCVCVGRSDDSNVVSLFDEGFYVG